MKRSAAVLICLLILIASAAGERPWIKVTSPHFTVVSDVGEGATRKIAAQFEQIRWVLMQVVPGLTADPNTPVLIVVVPDQGSMEALVGSLHRRVAGLFTNGRDHSYVIVRLDIGDWLDHAVVHEYVHLLAHSSIGRLPTWVDEGIAEFYGQCDLSGERVKFGRPIVRYAEMMRQKGLIPFSRLFVLNDASPEYTSDATTPMVYAESWSVVHYLLLGDDGAHSKQLSEYMSLLQHGKDSLSAAKKAFGDIDKLQGAVLQYMKRFSAPYRWVNLPRDDFSKQLKTTTLTTAETNYWQASVVTLHDASRAKALAEAAIVADLKFAPAHEALALAWLKEGDYHQAHAEFERALKLDPELYLSNYFDSVLVLREHGDAGVAEAALRRAIASNPAYAPASLALAQLLAGRPGSSKEALQLGWQAVQHENMKVGYHLAFGYMLLKAGMPEQAEVAAKHASDMYADFVEKSDAARLLALAQQCEAKHDCGPQTKVAPGSTSYVDPEIPSSGEELITVGVISGARCSKEARQVTLETADGRLDLALLPTTHVGVPDTFWIGPEYFNCAVLVDETAMVKYKRGPQPQPIRVEVLGKY